MPDQKRLVSLTLAFAAPPRATLAVVPKLNRAGGDRLLGNILSL